MRYKDRKLLDKVFILGAGSSYSLTAGQSNKNWIAPLDAEFPKRICDLQNKRGWSKEASQRILEDWLYHVDFNKMSLEKAISQQIADLHFLEAIQPHKGIQQRNALEYLEDVTYVISYILKQIRVKNKKAEELFIQKFFDYVSVDACPNRIITFNYDTIVDAPLIAKYKPQDVYFYKIKSGRNIKNPRVTHNRHPLLLKLHGSVNWYCTKDTFREIFIDLSKTNTKSFAIKDDASTSRYIKDIWIDYTCISPKDDCIPLTIPPIPVKPVTDISIFTYLWTCAYEYLHDCKEIVISGYSLPETDTLAVSLFSKFKNMQLTKLTIIDPSAVSISKWMAIFQRKNISRKYKIEYYPDFCQYIKNI